MCFKVFLRYTTYETMLEEKQKNQLWAILLVIVGILTLVSLLFFSSSQSPFFTSRPYTSAGNYIGKFGILVATYLYLFLGLGAFFVPFVLIRIGIQKFKEGRLEAPFRKGIGLIIFFIVFSSSLYLVGLDISSFLYGGGFLGLFFSEIFYSFFGQVGSIIILAGLLLISIILMIDLSPLLARRKIRKQLAVKKKPVVLPSIKKEGSPRQKKENALSVTLPSLSLLSSRPPSRSSSDEVKLAGKKLKQTLADFGVDIEIAEVKEGPAITRFEVKLAAGIKVSKLMSLSSDLALSLAVPNVRIEVPVSGKSLIGVEVPRKKINFVYLRELLELKQFRESESKLLFPLGKDITGEPVWVDLGSLPHLLIGGATGSGKSVCINSIIVSILYRSFPDEVKFLLIDPKTVELVDYIGIPHLIFPTITDVKQANYALEWIVGEVKRRYEKFNQLGVRDINDFNLEIKKETGESIPYLVVIIDELADLMMLAGAKLEKTICRIAQLARATGIHLIVATQRPSVDVITGLIKANFPSRISFAVPSQIDSRTILDTTGAEKLVGNGDMLYSPVEVSRPFRVQGSFISPSEVKRVVGFLKEQEKPTYLEEIVKGEEEREAEKDTAFHDRLYEEAKELVIRRGIASTSLLQRRLSIGYNRAARIMDELEREGVVGPARGSKAREVIMRGEK